MVRLYQLLSHRVHTAFKDGEDAVDDGALRIFMRLHVPKEVSKRLLDVDESVLNDLVLQPWWQLTVERINHKRLVARLALFHLDCIHEVFPVIWVKFCSSLVDLVKSRFLIRIVNIFHLRVDLV